MFSHDAQLSSESSRTERRQAWRYGFALGLAAASVAVDLPFLHWPFTAANALVLLVAAAALVRGNRNGLTSIRLIATDVVLVCYLGWRAIAELINAADLSHRASLGTVFELAAVFLSFLIARTVVSNYGTFVSFLKGVVLPSAAVSVVGVLQIAGFDRVNSFLLQWTISPGLESRTGRGVDLRATSFIGHWTSMGGYLIVITAVLCAILVIVKQTQKRISAFAVVMVLVTLLGQFSTLTIATVAISAMILLVTVFLLGARPLFIVPLGVALIIGLQLFSDEAGKRVTQQTSASNYTDQWSWLPESLSYRMYIWTSETLPAIFERPFTGWGVDVYGFNWTLRPETLIWTSPESEWLRTAITVGIIGLALQVATLLVVWFQVLRPARKTVGKSIIPLQVAFLGLIVISFAHSHLTNRGVPLILWITLGAVAALTMSASTASERARPARLIASPIPTSRAS